MPKLLSVIELSNTVLLSNISQFKKALPKGVLLTAVVKANAYGHGLKEVVTMVMNHTDAFQVDDIEELRIVRPLTKKPIFVFGFVQKTDIKELIRLKGILGVYNLETIEALQKEAVKQKQQIKIHLKIDAYLGRQGILIGEVERVAKVLKQSTHINLEAIYSHFSDTEDTKNLEHARRQYKVLLEAKEILKRAGFKNLKHHISATSGFLSDMKGNWGGEMVRLGIGLYGLWPSVALMKKCSRKIKLNPVLRWVSHLAQVKIVPKGFPIGYGQTFITQKTMRIGVVPQGYSDGYDRGFSNNAQVLVNGKRCQVIGRVAMNMIVINLTNANNAKLEDEVVLLGEQGNERITTEELAGKINTINYEIVARISPLLPRIYLKNNR